MPAGHLLFRDAAVYVERRKSKLDRKADAELDGEELRFEPEAKGRARVSFVSLMGAEEPMLVPKCGPKGLINHKLRVQRCLSKAYLSRQIFMIKNV